MTNSTFSVAHLHLQLNTSSPVPIGFGKVSGFYGPGAWSAYFLTACASWYSLCYRRAGLDFNTLLWIISLNGAAIDHLRHLHILSALKYARDPMWMKEAASVGAAFNVTYWGLVGLLYQILAVPMFCDSDARIWSKYYTLATGSLIPAVSIISTYRLVDDEARAYIPALYWKGMSFKSAGISWEDRGYYYTSIIPGIMGLLATSALFVLTIMWRIATWYPARGPILIRTPRSVSMYKNISSGIDAAIPEFVQRLGTSTWGLFITLLPYLGFVLAMVFMNVSLILVAILVCYLTLPIVQYIVAAYFRLGSSPSQSCFFMPCAPQSITELDQALGLVGGIFTFFIAEVGYHNLQHKMKDRRRRIEFERETTQRFEFVDMPLAEGVTQASAEPVDRDIQISETPVDIVSGRITWAAGARRVNSGIVAEEGKAQAAGRK